MAGQAGEELIRVGGVGWRGRHGVEFRRQTAGAGTEREPEPEQQSAG